MAKKKLSTEVELKELKKEFLKESVPDWKADLFKQKKDIIIIIKQYQKIGIDSEGWVERGRLSINNYIKKRNALTGVKKAFRKIIASR